MISFQFAAQVPNFPSQKFAPKLTMDRPKLVPEALAKSGIGETATTTTAPPSEYKYEMRRKCWQKR